MSTRPPPPRFVIVQQRARRRSWGWLLLALAWAGSLAAVWAWSMFQAAPRLPVVAAELDAAQDRLSAQQSELDELRQREATLSRSDQISRVANKQVEQALAEREDEIAELRADLAFYERLVGPAAKPQPLNVHSVEFAAERGGSWQYEIVLTQNLNRGVVSQGQLQFAVEGIRDGRMTTLAWSQLAAQGQPQSFSFRYFQRLKGSVMLPAGFTPQRVRVALRGGGVAVDQSFAWKDTSNPGTPS